MSAAPSIARISPGAPLLSWPGKGPRVTQPAVATLSQVYGHGEELGKMFLGDSLDMLTWLLANGYRETVDLVYIDPPFGGGALYSRKIHLRGVDSNISFTAPAYQDFWTDGEYLQFMYERLILIKELLKETGSLYLHVDTSQSHYLKVICDEIFGRESFQREIIWRIGWVSGYKSQARNWIRNHDNVLFYTKSPDNFFFDKQYTPYADGYKRRGGGKKGKGHPMEDTWNCSPQDRMDSIQIKSFSCEKTGYPTQKNEALLERIVRASSPEGGLVLDCFGGSGTTAYVARKTSRRWLACDVNPQAKHTARARLLGDGTGQLSSGFSIYCLDSGEPSISPTAEVFFKRSGAKVGIEITSFDSPAVRSLLNNKKIMDWRSIVDCVMIDLNYDGLAFRMDYADISAKGQPIRGTYNPRTTSRIAILLVDLLGNDLLVVEPQ